MTTLDEELAELRRYEGVEHVLIVGRDGLLIQEQGDPAQPRSETVAAMIPGLSTACTALGRAADRGSFTTAVLEFAGGVMVIAPVTDDALLGVLLRRGVGFAPLLRELRQRRDRFATLL